MWRAVAELVILGHCPVINAVAIGVARTDRSSLLLRRSPSRRQLSALMSHVRPPGGQAGAQAVQSGTTGDPSRTLALQPCLPQKLVATDKRAWGDGVRMVAVVKASQHLKTMFRASTAARDILAGALPALADEIKQLLTFADRGQGLPERSLLCTLRVRLDMVSMVLRRLQAHRSYEEKVRPKRVDFVFNVPRAARPPDSNLLILLWCLLRVSQVAKGSGDGPAAL